MFSTFDFGARVGASAGSRPRLPLAPGANIAMAGVEPVTPPDLAGDGQGPAPQGGAGAAVKPGAVAKVGDAVLGFVPTEVVAVYIPAVSLGLPVAAKLPWLPWATYGCGIALTTALVVVGYYKALPAKAPGLTGRVVGQLICPVAAFAVWGLTVPGVIPEPTATAVVGVFALLISPFLRLVSPK